MGYGKITIHIDLICVLSLRTLVTANYVAIMLCATGIKGKNRWIGGGRKSLPKLGFLKLDAPWTISYIFELNICFLS